jgi:cysteine desulfurase
MIYFDHNATTPMLPEVLEAMMPYLTTEWGNPIRIPVRRPSYSEIRRMSKQFLRESNGRKCLVEKCSPAGGLRAMVRRAASFHGAWDQGPGGVHIPPKDWFDARAATTGLRKVATTVVTS